MKDKSIITYDRVTEINLTTQAMSKLACDRLLRCQLRLISLNTKEYDAKYIDEYRSRLRKSINDLGCSD